MIECWNPKAPSRPHIVRIVKFDMRIFNSENIALHNVGDLALDGSVDFRPGLPSLSGMHPYLVWMSDGTVARGTHFTVQAALDALGQEWGD